MDVAAVELFEWMIHGSVFDEKFPHVKKKKVHYIEHLSTKGK